MLDLDVATVPQSILYTWRKNLRPLRLQYLTFNLHRTNARVGFYLVARTWTAARRFILLLSGRTMLVVEPDRANVINSCLHDAGLRAQ